MYKYTYKDLFELLPERYRKPNTEKLYYGYFHDRSDIRQALAGIEDSRDINKAYGQTLDNIGGNVGQLRQGEDDDLYRQLIKVRIIANLSLGNIPTINKVLSVLTKDVYLGLKEVWDKEEYRHEPSKIVIELDSSAKQFPFELVEAIKSAGVRVLTEIHYDSKLDEIWAGGRRRALKITYHEYQFTDIKGQADNIFAGRLVSMIRKEWQINRKYNLIAKGQGGYLTSDIGSIRGEIIE